MSCACGEDASSPKNFGDASLHPRAFQTELEEAYLFFFLAFFFAAILFSSQISESPASDAGGARIQSPCIRTGRNLVKRKVIVCIRKLQGPPRDASTSIALLECMGCVSSASRRDNQLFGESWREFLAGEALVMKGRDCI
jgi:hypothetical protein